MHNLAAGCTHFGTSAPCECTLFQNISIHYIGLNTRKIPQVHEFECFAPDVCAHDTCLILNTGVDNIPIQKRVSWIFDLGPNFYFMTKMGNFWDFSFFFFA